jgi:NAD(P)-dependent dehydrogenase (short-subunit alcohol dehydrogenase family)
MEGLNGKVALITGASGGIGGALVQAFMAAGAHVMASDVVTEEVSNVGVEAYRFTPADVSDEPSVQGLIAATVAAFGQLDVLANNAAVLVPTAPVHETSLEEFNRLVAVNLRGTFLCCKYAYPHLKASRGNIINISSMAGVNGEKHHAVYAATKGAVNALTQAMAVDYGADGIRCNAVCPSSVLTPKVDKMIATAPNAEEIVQLRKSINSLGYTATPQEIASVAVFLAAPAASFMTGAIIPVSGGSECGYGVKY